MKLEFIKNKSLEIIRNDLSRKIEFQFYFNISFSLKSNSNLTISNSKPIFPFQVKYR